ncbi:hypothetical protein [Halodesulfovibrio marinisediminis]|uniref:Uncharacterized protein n=1 Tax=Halodesulfovibrio marinisediminis DSM 17456 TaxID=1121457 RepID=A0A1N6FF91_9BACT|nr:hypothetical protein [Halodesulfovibrio marinisediminis]SIN93874.1 hypothetical protein SAMN02745161_1280 [Halodesulfovibrio marinisediminis DSM 17456]
MKNVLVAILITFMCMILLGCTEEKVDENTRTPEQEKAYKELFNSDSKSYFEKESKPVTTNNF